MFIEKSIHILVLLLRNPKTDRIHPIATFLYQFLTMKDDGTMKSIESYGECQGEWTPFPYLPYEMCAHIWSFLDKKSLSATSLTCKLWYSFSTQFFYSYFEQRLLFKNFQEKENR